MKKNEPKEIYGCELKKGKYYLRVFSDIYDDKTMKWIRRGIFIELNSMVARSLKAILPKLFKQDRSNIRYIDGFKGEHNTPLCNKRYRADINMSLDKYDGEKFNIEAGFQYF